MQKIILSVVSTVVIIWNELRDKKSKKHSRRKGGNQNGSEC